MERRLSRAPARRIMVVDDDGTTLLVAKRRLERDGFVVETRDSPLGTSNAIRAFEPDLVLIDVGMPAMDGDRLATVIRRSSPDVKIALYSDRSAEELAQLATDCGALGFILKSDAAELGQRVRELLQRSS